MMPKSNYIANFESSYSARISPDSHSAFDALVRTKRYGKNAVFGVNRPLVIHLPNRYYKTGNSFISDLMLPEIKCQTIVDLKIRNKMTCSKIISPDVWMFLISNERTTSVL